MHFPAAGRAPTRRWASRTSSCGRCTTRTTRCEDMPVTVTGFIAPAGDGYTDGYTIARMVISCCAADANPMQLHVDGDAPFPSNTWVEAVVTVVPNTATMDNGYVPTVTRDVADDRSTSRTTRTSTESPAAEWPVRPGSPRATQSPSAIRHSRARRVAGRNPAQSPATTSRSPERGGPCPIRYACGCEPVSHLVEGRLAFGRGDAVVGVVLGVLEPKPLFSETSRSSHGRVCCRRCSG